MRAYALAITIAVSHLLAYCGAFSTDKSFLLSKSLTHFLKMNTNYIDNFGETAMTPNSQLSNSIKFQRKFGAVAAGALFSLVGSMKGANAGLPFFGSEEQNAIDEISKFQRPVAELYDNLRPISVANPIGVYSITQVLRGGKEDSQVVFNYLNSYIVPCQALMEKIAPKLNLGGDAQTRVETLSLLMKGHIAELKQAIGEMKAESQLKEVEEVQDTLAEYLKLASAKYEVQPYIAPAPLGESGLFGPLSCEFWGKQRIPGSNQCQTVE